MLPLGAINLGGKEKMKARGKERGTGHGVWEGDGNLWLYTGNKGLARFKGKSGVHTCLISHKGMCMCVCHQVKLLSNEMDFSQTSSSENCPAQWPPWWWLGVGELLHTYSNHAAIVWNIFGMPSQVPPFFFFATAFSALGIFFWMVSIAANLSPLRAYLIFGDSQKALRAKYGK